MTDTARPARRRRPLDPDTLAELEEERAFLLRSLQDLEREHDAGDIDDADYTALKDGYTTRAAAVLRAIDEGRAALPPAPPRRWGRTIAVWATAVVVAIGLGIAVARFSGDRRPGESATGGILESTNSKLSQARQLQASDPGEAIRLYQEVLDEDPDNPEANAYLGWLTAIGAAGTEDEGLRSLALGAAVDLLDRAIAARPEYADPYCFKAIVTFRFLGDAAAAQDPVQQCLASDPPQEVAGLVQALSAQVEEALRGSAGSAPPTSAGG